MGKIILACSVRQHFPAWNCWQRELWNKKIRFWNDLLERYDWKNCLVSLRLLTDNLVLYSADAMGGDRGSGARGSGGSQNDGSGSGQDDDTYSSGYGMDDISFPNNGLKPWPPVVEHRPPPKSRPGDPSNSQIDTGGFQSATGSGAGRQITRISTLSWTSCILSLLLVTIKHWLCWCCCRVVIINHHLFCCAWWRHLYAQWWHHRYLW